MEEKNQIVEVNNEIDTTHLESTTKDLVGQIIQEDNVDKLKDLTKLFNINQTKKNLLRVVKLNDLLDKVNEQAIQRFDKRPDEISNKELLDYMQVVQNNIEKSQKSVEQLDASPMIQINNNSNEVNVNLGTKLDRDSRERVLDVVQKILKLTKESPETTDNIIQEPVMINVDEERNESDE